MRARRRSPGRSRLHPSSPETPRLDDPAHDGRVLLTLGGILTGVGVVATLVSNLLPFF